MYNNNVAITRSAQAGFVTGATLGGTSTAYTYNTFGELASERHTGAGAVFYDVAYTRDKLGRIAQRVETIGGVATTYGYVYDAAGRLAQVSKNGAVISAYAYDQNGNRLGKTDSIGTTAGTYDAQDRLLTYGANSYVYTANGELLAKTNPQGTTSYTYDVLGNLTAVTLPDGTLIEYVIDGSNRRVGKKINGVLVQGFLYANQLNPIAELDGAGNVVSTFIYGTKANVPDYMVKGGTTYRIISDHLGSPRLVVDSATGTVVQQITYDEFGVILTDTNPGFIPFGFGGGFYDNQTKFVRFGARDYDPDSGRWTSKDPIRFSGGDTNLYGYVFADPVNYLDPLGLTTWPANGPVTSGYNEISPIRDNIPHNGIDIGNPNGASVVSTNNGVVISIAPTKNGTTQVKIQNSNGSVSGYAHVQPGVSVGQCVQEGDPIGTTNLSGTSTGPHVHYTYKPSPNSDYVNPLTYLPSK